MPALMLAMAAVVAPGRAWAADAAKAAVGTSSIDPSAWVRHPQQKFSITAAEVTVERFKACIEAGKCDAANVSNECNFGKEDRDSYPVNCVNFDGASQYCAWAGGRLCAEAEWVAACKGTEERPFPYGQSFDPAACNVHSNAEAIAGESFDSDPVGKLTTCQGGLDGVYDLAGNVSEWLSDCKGTYCKFRGAGYLSNDPIDHFSGCGGVCSGNQKTLQSNTVGIRCCRDETD